VLEAVPISAPTRKQSSVAVWVVLGIMVLALTVLAGAALVYLRSKGLT
jgi:hypothetical protein